MRYALVRGWAVAATAILTGAVADAVTECAEDNAWLAGSVRDYQHAAIVPALALGAAIALALMLFVLLARITPRDPLLTRMNDARTLFVDISAALCGGMLCVIAMEAYETRFGGLSPFDPQSVVLSHTFALIAAFAIVGTLLHFILGKAIRRAHEASRGFIGFIAAFLHQRTHAASPPRATRLSALDLCAAHTPPGVARGSHCLRAPPRSILPLNVIAT
jgi:hypothetical protein